MEPNHIILDDEALKKALVLQIEYYFSDANLQKGQFFCQFLHKGSKLAASGFQQYLDF